MLVTNNARSKMADLGSDVQGLLELFAAAAALG
jgi:hypothetical protein